MAAVGYRADQRRRRLLSRSNRPIRTAHCCLADYLLGPEGQAVLEKFEYGSAAKNLGFKRWRPDHGIATDKYEKDLEHWEKLLKEISRRGA
jgi:hypothetical protein